MSTSVHALIVDATDRMHVKAVFQRVTESTEVDVYRCQATQQLFAQARPYISKGENQWRF